MPDPVDALVLDLLDRRGNGARPYPEVMEAWRTSCPKLPVWEEAKARGLIRQEHRPGVGTLVSVSAEGRAYLDARAR
jgi:D-3-phosphoglycerate dehydrogenase